MEKIFNFTSSFKALEDEDGSVMIRGMASTSDTDRANDVIKAEAWSKGGLENFKNNPIILFNHNYDKPIGRATGVKVTDKGLELEARISKSAPDNVAMLIKEGILGAFSVGFRVKDADYIKETDGLMIKDAELFEVSVVSVPCNQAATFSLAKSFDSMEEYEAFKKTFVNSVDEASEEVNASVEAGETRDEQKAQNKETTMSDQNNIDLEAFAKKVAEETAAKIAMKQAQEKAAKEAEEKALADKKAQEEQVKSTIEFGIQSGTERLLADVEAKLAAKDAQMADVLKSFEGQLNEKAAEIAKIRDSKRVFADRDGSGDQISKWGKEFMNAHMLSVMTGKAIEQTAYGRSILEKAGVDYATAAPNIATEVASRIEKEIVSELRLARAFREVQINSQAQVLPIQTESNMASWTTDAANLAHVENNPQIAAGSFRASQVVLKAYRLMSKSFLDNHIDEEVLVNLMPMLVDSVARAHARAVDSALINATTGSEGFDGLIALASTNGVTFDGDANGAMSASDFLAARKLMGKYGMNPSDMVYVVSQSRYYDLVADAAFADITDVGSELATKISGTVGSIYGTPVIVSDNFPADANTSVQGLAVNVRNFVIPRLRGVTVEQDYEVANQRRIVVASQSLGFNQLVSNGVSVAKLTRTDVA